MKLIIGLGNPGEKYANTRHNCGFTVVDYLLKNLGTPSDTWSKNPKLKSEIVQLTLAKSAGDDKVLLAKSLTFMNDSGQAARLLVDFYKIAPEDVWVVYDELDLPLGHMKIRMGGAAAGHHGVESVMEHLGTDKFWRFRLGIGTSHDKEHAIGRQDLRDAKEYVLDTFTGGEQGKARELTKRGVQAIETALTKGIESAMNRFNS